MTTLIRTTRRLLTALTLGLAIANPVFAVDDPVSVVKGTADQVIQLVTTEREALRADPDRLRRVVEEIIAPHFDFPRMAQWAVGKHWRGASEAEREQLVNRFRELLINTYSTALLEYSNQTINYQPVQAEDDAERVTVKTEIEQPGGVPVPVNYRMHARDGNWKVYDVAVDGVSFITTYRADFAAVIRDSGIAGLIDTLAQRTAANARQ